MKSILFNTDEVRATLDGRKNSKRLVVKLPLEHENIRGMEWNISGDVANFRYIADIAGYGLDVPIFKSLSMPYRPSDILYVRETWSQMADGGFLYRAWLGKGQEPEKQDEAMRWLGLKWRPPIHMPREAARIWLRVTDVRVERLQEMPHDAPLKEGVLCDGNSNPTVAFAALWDSTIKPADRERYGWAANPWVWVIAFERCEMPEEGA